MNINWNINWATWLSVCKAIGGACAAIGTLLGGIAPAIAPLAAVVPSLAPLAQILAVGGVAVHGVSTMAQSIGDVAAQAGQANGTLPK